ncbi:MAG: PhnA domain-containing protein [Chitinophagales bacterium]|nr:PhnA domain-containing protein [Chitinophagales bacterium]
MTLEERLIARSGNKCELCEAEGHMNVYEVPPQTGGYEEHNILICDKCLAQIDKKEELDNKHWNVLTTSMWSEVPGVQVVSWRMLNRLRNEAWAAESLDMMYMDDEQLAWAKTSGDHENDASVDLHKDANGAQLFNGDSVVLTKSLDVKGSTVNARVGTVIKNIHLVSDNTEQIEGRIEGQMIVVLTKYVRRQAPKE